MKTIRSAIFLITFTVLISIVILAQEQAPSVYLDTFEKCNNYARHFCLNGSHEAAVNRALLDMKRKGYPITPKVIQNVARATPSRLSNPVSGTVE